MLKGNRERLSKKDYFLSMEEKGLSYKNRIKDDTYNKFSYKFHQVPTHKKRIKSDKILISEISWDSNKNFIVCVSCETPICTKKDNDDFCPSTAFNCCYDCDFSCYCDNCCFTFKRSSNSEPFKTCGITFMKSLINPNYGSGRYSLHKEEP